MADQSGCEKSCKGRILDKTRGIYCPCIEKKLPKLSQQSVKAVSFGPSIERFSEVAPGVTPEAMEEQLEKFGLKRFEVDLIMARYCDNKPFLDLTKEQGWVNPRSASYYLRKTLAKLRKGGFRFHET